ncbi:MAG: winged helix-turn-helix domain-containing protein [Sedimenticola sp.]
MSGVCCRRLCHHIFLTTQLIARIKVILGLAAPHATDEVVEAGGVALDPSTYRVTINGEGVELGPTEFKLLHFFMTHRDKVNSHTRLLDRVRGTHIYIEERTVDVHIRRAYSMPNLP